MPTETRRIMLSLSESLARSLRTLGLDPDLDRDSGNPPPGATQITAALARYADAVDRAGRELDRVLKREEWNMLADLTNGCADLWDYSETPTGSMFLIIAQVEDGQRLDGAGDKWLANELEPRSGDKATAALVAKLKGLSQIHGDAILAACRYFWTHADIDHQEAKWWTVAYRTGEIAATTRKAAR